MLPLDQILGVLHNHSAKEPSRSQLVKHYLQRDINIDTLSEWVKNYRATYPTTKRRRKKATADTLPGGQLYESLMKQKLVTKQRFQGIFKIPCDIGKLKGLNAVADQGSEANLMPLSI